MQAERHKSWLPSAERDKEDPELAAVLRQVSDKIKSKELQSVPLCCTALPQTDWAACGLSQQSCPCIPLLVNTA